MTLCMFESCEVFPTSLISDHVRSEKDPRMSAGLSALALIEDDVTKMLAATTHIGSDNSETTMEQYVWKKKTDGVGCSVAHNEILYQICSKKLR